MHALLLKSIEEDNFYLEFKPKMIKNHGHYHLHGAEELIRWKPIGVHNISPAIFIPLPIEDFISFAKSH